MTYTDKEDPQCYKCKKTAKEQRLLRCVICHRIFCDDCSFVKSGHHFCSRFCAEYFFYDEDED